MSKISREYQNQINDFCENTNTLTAEDILAKKSEPSNIISISKKRKHVGWKMISTAAAVCIVVGLGGTVGAGAAGFGPFASLFLKAPNDDTSSKSVELAEGGYLYEINEEKSDGIYTATLYGIAGDEDNPMLIMKLHIDDEEFVEANESINVTVYAGIEKNRYETQRIDLFDTTADDFNGAYGFNEAVAQRDDENPGDYYFTTRGYMIAGEPTVVAVRSIRYNFENGEFDEIRMDIRFDVTLPGATMKETITEQYGMDVELNADNGVTYLLREINLNQYYSTIFFNVDDTVLQHSEADDERLQEEWVEISKDLKLVVDGTEYEVVSVGQFFCSHMGDTGVDGICSISAKMDAVPYEEAQNVELYYKGELVKAMKLDGEVVHDEN